MGGIAQLRPNVMHRSDGDVVQTEEAALEDVPTLSILAVDLPGEIHHQLQEHPLQEGDVADIAGRCLLALAAVDLEDAERGPCMHGRIGIAERPFIGGELAVGMQIAPLDQERELGLGEGGSDIPRYPAWR